MTKQEFRKNYRKLCKTCYNMLRTYEDAALKSKAFDLESETSTWGLPKDVITAALDSVKDQYSPHSWDRKGKRRAKNIYLLTYPDYSQCR
jgi:hypothetical protein